MNGDEALAPSGGQPIPGQVVEVRVDARGSQLVSNVSSGATTLLVEDPTPFDDAGGQVKVGDVVYTYTDVVEVDDPDDPDVPNALMTLASPAVAEVATTPVWVWSGAQVLDDLILVIDIGEELPVEVAVTSDKRKDWVTLTGTVEPPISVSVAPDLSAVIDAPGHTPRTPLESVVVLDEETGSIVSTAVEPNPDPALSPPGEARFGLQPSGLFEGGAPSLVELMASHIALVPRQDFGETAGVNPAAGVTIGDVYPEDYGIKAVTFGVQNVVIAFGDSAGTADVYPNVANMFQFITTPKVVLPSILGSTTDHGVNVAQMLSGFPGGFRLRAFRFSGTQPSLITIPVMWLAIY